MRTGGWVSSPFPYAGITRIRSRGYNLRRCLLRHPQRNLSLTNYNKRASTREGKAFLGGGALARDADIGNRLSILFNLTRFVAGRILTFGRAIVRVRTIAAKEPSYGTRHSRCGPGDRQHQRSNLRSVGQPDQRNPETQSARPGTDHLDFCDVDRFEPTRSHLF